MKTYKYLILALVGLSIAGCSNLEEVPVSFVVPEGFSTLKIYKQQLTLLMDI
jgi:hypothetical protein